MNGVLEFNSKFCLIFIIFFFCKVGEFQSAGMIVEPKSSRKSRCLRLAIQLVPREIHFFNPLTMNRCFVLVLAEAAPSAVATVTVAGLLCVKKMEDLF